MLKHRIIQPVTYMVFVLLVVLCFMKLLPWWVLFLPVVFYLACVVVGSYFIQLNYFVLAFNKGSGAKKQIALTFDDGPLELHTENVLQLLQAKEVKATFFLIGKQIARHEVLVRRIYAEGHLVGNHSYVHSNSFPVLGLGKMKTDLKHCTQEINRILGVEAKYFRPPFGVTNPTVAKAATELGYKVIGWSVRSYDTTISSEKILMKRLQKAKEGDIVLLHDWGAATLKVLPEFIDAYRAKGFEFVRVDELEP
ncbi:MAG: polysaccharide deacetylase family protein [Chitinophagales bacterium]|nr:polysaccharide deacetylase family protein [Chitinophagales bacterium]